MSIITSLSNNLLNIPGWHTNRHIVVIESDDWGSIRMPSKSILESLRHRGLNVDNCPFTKYDSLASADDLEKLYEVLSSVKDRNGNHAVLTANTVVANPNFEKIRNSNFQYYYFEAFTETLKRYSQSHQNSFKLWKEGLDKKLFIPQLHGREHLNIFRWMQALRDHDIITVMAFQQEHFGLSKLVTKQLSVRYMDAFSNVSNESVYSEREIINDAALLFKELFGFVSESFIAPCYIWRSSLEKSLYENGIKYIQGLSLQQIPVKENPLKVKVKYHYFGQRNFFNQIYLIRNSFFEPYKNNETDKWVNECLYRINVAFRWKKPAIISSHRLNFIGSIDSSFRDKNLFLFKHLLQEIVKKWPDVEFLSTNQLGRILDEH